MGSPKEMTICTKQFKLLFIYEVMSVGVELYTLNMTRLNSDWSYSERLRLTTAKIGKKIRWRKKNEKVLGLSFSNDLKNYIFMK